VAPETRERIERVMAELGLRRNVVARARASRPTQIIALVYPMLEHRFGGSVTEFITSGAWAASAANYHLVIWPVGNDGSELAAWSARSWSTARSAWRLCCVS
jgi:DNA-binding LacI/PurR family transcriptional regulator